jgi:hypothetical protein
MGCYEGEALNMAGVRQTDFSESVIVAVRGSGRHPRDHLLIHGGERRGYYHHLAAVHDCPRYMDEPGYARYLKESGRAEVRRVKVTLANPAGARRYLTKLLAERWIWGALPPDGTVFVERIVKAGGGDWGGSRDHPTSADHDFQDQVDRAYQSLTNQIYRLYGVPR